MSDREKLKTYLLIERAYIATVEDGAKVKIAIDATDQMLKDLKANYQDEVNITKSYYVTYGCYSNSNNCRLTTILFLSPILAEIVKLSENLQGNNFEVVQATPEILGALSFLFVDPKIYQMAVSLGAVTKDKKPLVNNNGSIVLNNNSSLTYIELQEFIKTAILPESYLQRLESQSSREVVYRYTQAERANFAEEDTKAVSRVLLDEILSDNIRQENVSHANGVRTY